MKTIVRPQELQACVRAWRAQGQRIAFVPTMGNLHAGHGDLVARARKTADRVVASVFVNPMQFGPNEDFEHYPRTPAEDQALLGRLGVDVLFTPEVADMYPHGHEDSAFVDVPDIGDVLCGEFRPGHFRGVATVVVKLLNLVEPDVALFGEKDFQQLTIIKRVTVDLCMPVKIVGAPTVREADGLAMSSRNRYLTERDRIVAPAIFQALTVAREHLQSGRRDYTTIESAGKEALAKTGFKVDYFAVCDARTLRAPTPDTRDWVIAVAARIGKARLIDNVRFTQI